MGKSTKRQVFHALSKTLSVRRKRGEFSDLLRDMTRYFYTKVNLETAVLVRGRTATVKIAISIKLIATLT